MSTARRASPEETRQIEDDLCAGVYPGIRVDLPPPNRHWFVSEVGGERVGFACLSVDKNDLVGVLCRCWVHPRFRGNGVAGALWQGREALAQELHVALLQVIVNTDEAEEKYKSRGFRVQIALGKGRRLMVRP
jgi:GNAT superfamily N-acetyltransferase